jgi:hypothetical protein
MKECAGRLLQEDEDYLPIDDEGTCAFFIKAKSVYVFHEGAFSF